MPIVNVKLLEGRSDDQLKDLVSEVTQAVEKTTGANKEAIQVVIEEMKASQKLQQTSPTFIVPRRKPTSSSNTTWTPLS